MIKRDFLFVDCENGGHLMQFRGGANAGCDEDCACSVPVHECVACGLCDYGQNEEADQIRKDCAMKRGDMIPEEY